MYSKHSVPFDAIKEDQDTLSDIFRGREMEVDHCKRTEKEFDLRKVACGTLSYRADHKRMIYVSEPYWNNESWFRTLEHHKEAG